MEADGLKAETLAIYGLGPCSENVVGNGRRARCRLNLSPGLLSCSISRGSSSVCPARGDQKNAHFRPLGVFGARSFSPFALRRGKEFGLVMVNYKKLFGDARLAASTNAQQVLASLKPSEKFYTETVPSFRRYVEEQRARTPSGNLDDRNCLFRNAKVWT